MKKSRMIRFTAILLVCILLSGCASAEQHTAVETVEAAPGQTATAAATGESGRQAQHTIVERVFPTYIENLDTELTEPYPLYFADSTEDLPYVELYSWAELLYFLNREYVGDPGYELTIYEKDNNNVVLERDNGYTLTIDFDQGKLVFDDYDAFIHNSNETTLIDLLSESGFNANGEAQLFQRNRKASFDRYGDVMTVDLAAYGIELIAQEGKYYLPLQTMNDFLISPMRVSFLFNGKALILANDDMLFDYEEGSYTDLAEFYYSVPQAQRSDALAEYSYNELCLVLDSLYGLKEPHDIQSFRKLFWQIGYDEVLSGNDPVDADNALKSFIDYTLDDLHSVFNEYSWMAGLDAISDSTGFANRKIMEHSREYAKAREIFYPDGCPGYEEVGDTAFVTFDRFSSRYKAETFYVALETGEISDDTIGLIIYAHSQITRENSPIKNVVLDLSNNTGGAVDAGIFTLGWFLGDAPFSVKDMATGAMSTSVYRADVNLDRSFDEKDTVQDKNLFCLISPVSFSCGNLVPAALKSSQKVTLIGRTTGGGSCVVQPLSTAYGSVFQISSAMRLSFLKNGSFYDIDQGVDPDIYLSNLLSFYDRKLLNAFIDDLI
ncbi:MAG: S41 family peptidase [Oscillospiraceae bacterium]|nr:S41 family peptidase [Oscillospiraceae bacterium]